MILPVFAGSGMKVKTCEALMYGRNILGTDEAFAGYSLEYGEVGGLCNTAADFIKAIRSFCDSPRPRFNEYSRRRFLDSYSNEAQIPLFAKLIL